MSFYNFSQLVSRVSFLFLEAKGGVVRREGERIDRSKLASVKFQFQNLERRSVKVPKFGTTIRIDVKITAFRHALAGLGGGHST